MAAELLLELGFQYSSSSSSLPHLAETSRDRQTNLNGFNPMQMPDAVDDDDSWEVRAFAEDTANVMGTTWPPRSYTCTYCRREFRSAQALGGHMNVHRRDRARLHQVPPPTNPMKPSSSSSSSTSNSFIIPASDFNGGGLCLLYQFPNPNSSINGGMINSPSSTLNAYIHSPASSLFSMSHHSFSSFTPSTTSPSPAFPVNNHRPGGATTFSPSFGDDEQHQLISTSMENDNQELDLELRLGHGPPNSTQTLMEKGHKISNLEAACLRKRSSD